VVLAAEGVKSRGRELVLGCEDRPLPSGYAVFRTLFEAGEEARNETTRLLVEGGDSHYGWIGEDVHFLAASIKDGKEMSWVCTHKDEGGIEESWQFPGKIEDVLKVVEGREPVVLELVKITPPERLFDYKLVFREPLPTFVSPKARTALIGDAAHPFLPTSIHGASQAMEDGVVLAACLDKAGKD
jgi:2-polyprenyl-6-methoxyphenol hydroxylase-like FAD-dependent oxidoreductase